MTCSKPPRGEIVNPHVLPYVPEPKPNFAEMQRRIETAMRIGAIIQLADWSAKEFRRCASPTGGSGA